MSAPVTAAGSAAELSDEDLLAAYAWDSHGEAPGLPLVRFNFVASLDGAAAVAGRSGGLGNSADHRVFNLLRRSADVILVGAGTVRAEGYAGELLDRQGQAWRAARGMAPHPATAIVSGSLDLDPDGPLFSQAPVRPLLLTSAGAPADRRTALAEVADVVAAGARDVQPALAVRELVNRGFTRILCEGGPRLFGTFQAAGLVDELCLTLSPGMTAGSAPRITSGAPETPLQHFALVHALQGGDTLLLRYRRPGS